MCGICGRVDGALLPERLLRAMETMAHRGPDQQGFWRQGRAVLGHRRLSIIDLSEDGRQPMSNEDGTIILVFNGEIYNFAELRELLEPYHRFSSHTDSEVLIHGYEHWGIDGLLTRVRGMFALGIWDEPRATLHLVRDHLGKKPLYYSGIGGGLSFASTLPALLDVLGTTPDVAPTAILDYLTYMCVPAPGTIFAGVYKLEAAQRLEYRVGQQPQLIRYWQPSYAEKLQLSEEEWIEAIDALLREAVRDRLIADVPLGAFLSGGIDSSLIVALMTEISGKPVTTISMGFPEQQFSELGYARQVAEMWGTHHHEYMLEPDAAETLPALVFHYGEPFADHSALPSYYLAQLARRHVTVVLTGDGGDETFAGYHSSPAVSLAQLLRHVPGVASGRVATTLRSIEPYGSAALRKLWWVAELGAGPSGNYVFDPIASRTFRMRWGGLFGPALSQLASRHNSDRLYQRLWQEAGDVDWVDRALYVDMAALLPNDLLVKVDVATMAHGVEARAPWLDRRLVELSCRIPPQLKIRGWRTKHLLKRLAARYIPRQLLHRPKQGFSLPTSHWLRGELGEALAPILLSDAARRRGYFRPEAVERLIAEHVRGKVDHGQRLWLLLMLELWFRMFIDRDLMENDGISSRLSKFKRSAMLVLASACAGNFEFVVVAALAL
jgi:asparagine synthase (glutamine-hydrolysing)